jgi:hypothetical protein
MSSMSSTEARSAQGGMVAAVLWLATVLVVASCASPHRGEWHGTFDGTVAGTVEMEIGWRGTKVRGEMRGQTRDGQPFEAKLGGTLAWDRIQATFRGASRSGAVTGLPITFEGEMAGSLLEGRGEGEWAARLFAGRMPMSGTWRIEQVEE